MNLKSLSKVTLGILVILIIGSPILALKAETIEYQITSGENDLFFTDTGSLFQYSDFIKIKTFATGVRAYFRFDNVNLEPGESIQGAILSLRSTWVVKPQGTVSSTIYGLKDLDLEGSWAVDDPAFITSIPLTNKHSNVNISGLHDLQWQNYTITGIVQELTGQYGFSASTPLGFTFSTVEGVERDCYAWEAQPSSAAKLYIIKDEPVPPPPEPGEPEPEFIEVYQNITIWTAPIVPQDFFPVFYDEDHPSFLTFNATIGSPIVILSNNSAPVDCSLLTGQTTFQNINEKLYCAFWNTTGTDHMSMAFSEDSGGNWTNIFDFEDPAAHDIETCGWEYVPSSNLWWFTYGRANNDLMVVVYNATSETFSTPYELHDSLNAVPGGSYIRVFDDGTVYIAFTAQPTAASDVDGWSAQLTAGNSTWGKKQHESPVQTTTSSFGLDYFRDPNTTQEYVVYVWTVTDLSGISDNRAWAFSIEPDAGDTVYDVPNDINASGLPTNWGLWSDAETRRINSFVIDPDTGSLFAGGYKTFGGLDTPAMMKLPYGNNVTRWDTTYTQHDSAIPTIDVRYNRIYWNPYYGNGSASMILGRTDRVKYYIDASFMSGNGSTPWTWLGSSKTAGAYADTALGDPPVTDWFLWLVTPRYYVNATFGAGFIVSFQNGTRINSTCIDLATTLEEAQACIDGTVGTQPQNPNPPGSTYPPDGFGQLTRFNLRFVIWGVGWLLIFIPAWAMAWKPLPWRLYAIMFFMMVVGLALEWTIASI